MKFLSVTIQMKAIEQYYSVAPFIIIIRNLVRWPRLDGLDCKVFDSGYISHALVIISQRNALILN